MWTSKRTTTRLRLDNTTMGMVSAACSPQQLGKWGEDRAAEWLSDHGFTIVERNWRFQGGELDIIATTELRDCEPVDGALGKAGGSSVSAVLRDRQRDSRVACVVVEVKTRRTQLFGGGIEAITRRKQRTLRRGMGEWLRAHPRMYSQVIRIDLIDIAVDVPRACVLEHFEEVA
ncbi:YraN family protein [Corynebacterium kroppenstedtii]